MVETISSTTHTARKDYNDDSHDWIEEYFLGYSSVNTGLTFKEMRAIVEKRKKGWKILKGEKYSRYVGKFDGDIFTNKSTEDMTSICHRLNLYSED